MLKGKAGASPLPLVRSCVCRGGERLQGAGLAAQGLEMADLRLSWVIPFFLELAQGFSCVGNSRVQSDAEMLLSGNDQLGPCLGIISF